MDDVCRNQDRAWIPECIGGAVYGRKGCTCFRDTPRRRTLDAINRFPAGYAQLPRPALIADLRTRIQTITQLHQSSPNL